MDVTPQLLQDIEFREKVRGYHPDDVDDFLERVGVAFSELVDRLRQANERADAAEAALADRAEVDESTLSRTLVLAQRTADAAITEAKAEAELTLSEARSEAERAVAEAETEAQQLVSSARTERDELVRAAEADALAKASAVTGPIEEEIERLEARRDAIVAQSGGLESWLEAQRVKLESVATDLQGILDDPDRLRADPAPHVAPDPATSDTAAGADLTLVESDAPSEVGGEPAAEVPSDEPTDVADAEPASDDGAPPEDGFDGDGAQPEPGLSSVEDDQGEYDAVAEVEVEAEGSGSEGDAHHEAHDDAGRDETDRNGADAVVVDLDAVEGDDHGDRPSRVSVVRSSVQPDGTEVVEEPTGASDSFLEELRRAVEAPTDVVESEEDRALSAFFEHEDEEPKRRFGRRR